MTWPRSATTTGTGTARTILRLVGRPAIFLAHVVTTGPLPGYAAPGSALGPPGGADEEEQDGRDNAPSREGSGPGYSTGTGARMGMGRYPGDSSMPLQTSRNGNYLHVRSPYCPSSRWQPWRGHIGGDGGLPHGH